MKPITAVVREKGGAKTYPVNQEVTLNADGSGGPIYKIGLQGLGAKGNKGYKVGSEVTPESKRKAQKEKNTKGRVTKY